MSYKLLGFVVWQASKWYLRRRVPGTRGKIALAVVSGAVMAGVAAAGRQAAHSD